MNLSFKRVDTLPVTLDPSTFYIVKGSGAADVELYFSDNTGSSARHVTTEGEIDSKIAAAIAAAGGGGGGSGITMTYAASRYEALSSTNYKVHCNSTAPQYNGVSWERIGTSLTVTHAGHGRSVGERAILKDVNVQVLNSLITNVTTDTYTVTCADTGPVNGTNGKYTMGFKHAHNSEVAGALTGGTLSAPANVDIILTSMRIHAPANSRAGATYDLVLPVTAWNSVIGPGTGRDELYLPNQQVRTDSDVLPAIGNTIAVNQSSAGYATLRFGALGATTGGILMLLQF